MAGYNDITGARLVSRANTKAFSTNYDNIFNKRKPVEVKLLIPTEWDLMFDESQLIEAVKIVEASLDAGVPLHPLRAGLLRNVDLETESISLNISPELYDRIEVLGRVLDLTTATAAFCIAYDYVVWRMEQNDE